MEARFLKQMLRIWIHFDWILSWFIISKEFDRLKDLYLHKELVHQGMLYHIIIKFFFVFILRY